MTPEVEAARSELIERLTLTDPCYDESFDRIVRLLRAITGSTAAAFTVLDGGRQFYKSQDGLSVRETPRDVSYCTHTIEQTEMLVVADALLDARFASSPLASGPGGHRFYAGLPVRAPSGLPLGALCILGELPRLIDDEERAALEDLRGVLEEALLLRTMAVVDTLTGLFNRRHFEEVVGREWRRGFAAQLPVAVMMADVDHFKRYNDTYGHGEGDVCLRKVAGALRSGVRRVGDVLARIGGEEFAMVMPSAGAADALELAERIRRAVRALDIPHSASPFGQVSISMGIVLVTEITASGISITEALAKADAALYQAKQQGRDRAVIV